MKYGINPYLSSHRAYRRTHMALELMIQNCIEAQREALDEKHYDNMSPMAFCREFCTVTLGGPRQSGHSCAMLDVGFMYSKPIFFVMNANIARRLALEIKEHKIDTNDKPLKCFVFDDLKTDKLRGVTDFNAVFVDMSSFCSTTWKDNLYSALLPAAIRHFDEKIPFTFVWME